MTAADVVRAIRARWLLFTVCCIVPVAAAFAVVRASPPVYSSAAELYVGPARPATGVDTYQSALSAAELAQQQAPSYASLVNSPVVLQAVIADLHLATTSAQLSGQVSATSPANSVLIDITARGGSAGAARDIANETALRFAGLAERVAVSVRGQRAVGPSVRLTLVKPALLPTAPTSPKKTTDLALGLVVGLAVGLTAVILREKTDRRVRTVSQARSSSGCSLVTSVGDTGGRAGSLIRRAGLPIRAAGPGSSAAESFRRLRLGLAPALTTHHAQSIAVTSLAPGDSGPAVATNLALALAEADAAVLLVDADARGGQIAHYPGLDSRLGLTTLISEDISPEPPSPSDLAEFLGTWREIDYIIVRVGAVLAHAAAAELSAAAHTVLLVTQRDKARQQDLRLATEMLRSANADLVGVVLAPAHLAIRTTEYRIGRPRPIRAGAAASNGQGTVAAGNLAQSGRDSRPGPDSAGRE